MSSSNDCPICLDKYTSTVRKEVKCQYCQYGACVTCLKRYMLETVEDPHCMNCRRAWNRDFIDSYLTLAFRKGPLKKHREDILLDREKARLPLLQPRVEARVQADAITLDIGNLNKHIRDLEIELAKQRDSVYRLQRRQHRLREMSAGRIPIGADLDGTGEKKEIRQFTHKCPVEDCRGFLSSAWKCGTCQTWVCPDCLVPKGKDKDSAHTCNEDAKATAALIKKETKPCPKCGMAISKIDGCFAKGTPILHWDGHYSKAEDIKVGDILVGDDGNARTVEHLCSGGDEMFEVSQGKGMSYVVNSKHKLALKFSGEKSILWSESEQAWKVRWFDRDEHAMKSKKIRVDSQITKEDAFAKIKSFCNTDLTFDEVIEITVDDYNKLTESTKKHLMGFKSTGVNWPAKDISLDPYLFGLWLGDGINDGMSFAVNPEADPEILKFLLDWCDQNSAELIHDEAYRFRIRRREATHGRLAIGHGASCSECKGCKEKKCDPCDLPDKKYIDEAVVDKRHPLKELLDKYDLTRKTKYIPDDYLINSREVRLQLLAGLIDTDGYVGNSGKRIQISQANHDLAKQIEFLAQSLGFVVHTDLVKKHQISFPNVVGKKDYPDHYRVNISGQHLSEIPTRVARKKCIDSESTKDELRTSISVKSVGQGTYYGWSVTANKRFLLADFTVARNCDQMWCVSCQTPFSWATGRQVFGVVHNPHYYQWLRGQNGGEAPRVAGDIPCGGLVGYYQLAQALPSDFRREVEQIHRLTAEMTDYILPNYPRLDEVPDNGDLGIEYTLKTVDLDTWKKELWKRETKREKGLDLRGPLDLFTNVSSEVLRRMAQRPSREEFLGLLEQLRALRNYVNEEFAKVGSRYGNMTPKITECWRWDIHGNNRGEEKDSREHHERTFVDSEENLKKLTPAQLAEIRRIREWAMPLAPDSNGNKRYGFDSQNFNNLTAIQREAVRILCGERNVVIHPTTVVIEN